MPGKKIKKIIPWVIGGLVLLVVLIGATAIFVLRSRGFHQYVQAKIIQKLGEATGGRIEMGGFAFDWSAFRAHIYRLVIYGREADSSRPLLQVDQVDIGFKIISALGRKIDLREIHVVHPVVYLPIDAAGHTNIPEPGPPTKDRPSLDIFELAVKFFLLERGEVYYNDQQIPFQAELHGLQIQIRLDPAQPEYRGFLAYRQGLVRSGNLVAFRHDLEMPFAAARTRLTLDPLRLTMGSSRLSARVILRDYSHPQVESTYQALLSLQDLRPVMKDPLLAQGEITTNGSLRYRAVPGASFLDRLSLEGAFSSPRLAVHTSEFGGEIHTLQGRYRLDEGNLEAHPLEADLLGGHATADLTIRHWQENPEFRFQGSVHGIALEALRAALHVGALQGMPIAGRLDGKGEATWQGALGQFKAQADATLRTTTAMGIGLPAGTPTVSIPLEGIVHLAYDHDRNLLSLRQTHLRSLHTVVELDGALSDHARMSVQVRVNDLEEVDRSILAWRKAAMLRHPRGMSPPELLSLSGSAAFNGKIEGSLKDPHITGLMTAANVRFQESRWQNLRAAVSLSSSGVAIQQGMLVSADGGRIGLEARVGLQDWNYTPSSSLAAQASVRELSLPKVGRVDYPITGTLSAALSVRGSQLNPIGEGWAQLTAARLYGEPINQVTIGLQATGDVVRVSPITVRAPAGTATGHLLYYPKSQGYELQVNAPRIQLDQIEAVRARALPIRGILTASARGRGTVKAPQLDVSVDIPEFRMHREILKGIQARASLADRRAHFTVDSIVTEAFIQARGTVDLTGNYYATATLDMRNVLPEALLASYLPAPASAPAGGVRGQMELHVALKGPLKDASLLEAHVEIPTLSAAYQSLQVAGTAPIRMNYRNGRLHIERAEFKGTDTDLPRHRAWVPVPFWRRQ